MFLLRCIIKNKKHGKSFNQLYQFINVAMFISVLIQVIQIEKYQVFQNHTGER
jgi:hypothetical protein